MLKTTICTLLLGFMFVGPSDSLMETFQFTIDRSPNGQFCGRLQCWAHFTATDPQVFAISSLTILEGTPTTRSRKLVSVSIFNPRLDLGRGQDNHFSATGWATRYNASLSLSLKKQVDCLQRSFVCEMEFYNPRGDSESTLKVLDSVDGGQLQKTSLFTDTSTSIPQLQSSSIPQLQSSSLPQLQSSSLPKLQSSSLPQLQSSSLPQLQSSNIPQLQSSSLSQLQSSSTPQLQSSSLPKLQSSSLPLLQSSSIPQLQSSSLPQLQSSSLPQLQSSSLPHLQSSSLPQLQSSSIPQLQSSSLPQLQSSSLPQLLSSSLPQLQSSSLPQLQSSSIPQLQSSSIPQLQSSSIPQLQSSNSGVKVLRFNKAQLHCVFSGYDPNPPHFPLTKWFDDSGQEINSNADPRKYSLSDQGRTLTINSVVEEDEKNYYCQASNSLGTSGMEVVFLDVTSGPIFVPGGSPTDQTVVEDEDVVFRCETRSTSGEPAPNPPIWSLNRGEVGQQLDPTKYQLTNDNKTLTIKMVKKITDILCVQCEVRNHVDTTWGDACLTVILPIIVVRRPEEEQEISYGDVVDLTVFATTDPSLTLSQKWEFKNKTDRDNDLPPHVGLDPNTKEMFINTSQLTEEEFSSIEGTYRCILSHTYQTEIIIIHVRVINITTPLLISCGFESLGIWTVGLIIGTALLLNLIIICIIVIRRRKHNNNHKGTVLGLNSNLEAICSSDFKRKPPSEEKTGNIYQPMLPRDPNEISYSHTAYYTRQVHVFNVHSNTKKQYSC